MSAFGCKLISMVKSCHIGFTNNIVLFFQTEITFPSGGRVCSALSDEFPFYFKANVRDIVKYYE